MTMNRLHFPLLLLAALPLSCRADEEARDRDFHTSGSREADQRAEQRVSKVQQMRGEGEGSGKGEAVDRSLFEKLGGDEGIRQLVDDFVDRAIADPRTNWERKGVKRGGVLGIGGSSAEWKPTPENVARVKHHMAQFIAVATGGPARYEGRDLKELHKGMKISNAEFDASIGALKATLDVLRVANEEQKELISILESARPQIAEER
jgi:hemoglobin